MSESVEKEDKAKKTKECTHCKEYIESLKRLQAEFENYRKRTNNAVEQAVATGKEYAAAAFLPALDSIEEALKLSQDNDPGIILIKKQLEKALGVNGIVEIVALNKPYDPNFHNVVMAEEGSPQSTVTAVWQKGYTINGKVLRPASVKINK
ncbi:MAG: nucleotide exchange factor GrpE [Firmicutes bacterium]|nr:nucleotide exchange factor GrpE [Bacillota bacterium]